MIVMDKATQPYLQVVRGPLNTTETLIRMAMAVKNPTVRELAADASKLLANGYPHTAREIVQTALGSVGLVGW